MKRSKTVQLLLISASPFYLTACNQENYSIKTVQETKNYADLQSCLNDKQPAPVCSKAFAMVKDAEKQNPISYKTKEDCEQDFEPNLCVATNSTSTTSSYYARSSGFQLTASRQVAVNEEGQVLDPTNNNFAEKVAKKDINYTAEPLYKPREGRTPVGLTSSTETSTLHASSGAHPVSTAASAAAAGYMAHRVLSNQGTGFAFNDSTNKPRVKRYSSGGAYKSSHYSSSRGGFSSRSSSRSFFGG